MYLRDHGAMGAIDRLWKDGESGMIRQKYHGNTLTTPGICLSMMTDFVIASQGAEPHSYIAIADGHKGQKMAEVYAGFYDYDDATIKCSKQQRVSIVLSMKPGNYGKCDSQNVLIAFLHKVMSEEKITIFEYEFFNPVWRVAGVVQINTS